ncbi:MAG: VacJ family lipoprotein [Henriciella sp.]|nr:VacJ family lipoprotein [Henriciella sp.]
MAFAALGAALTITGCASTTAAEGDTVYDPFEGFNRSVYGFNENVDKAVLRPVAMGYRSVTNEPVRNGVSNFLTNLNQPVVFSNAVLQGKPYMALDTLGRFLVNTTFGIGGIFDPATAAGVPEHREDFGQTLGTWGVGEGAYLMLPLLGPSNVRDLAGTGVDAALDPLNWATFEGDTEFRIGTGATGAVAARERLDDQITQLREQPEPYTFLRRNYSQTRQAAIRDGKEVEDPFANLPDFEDYDFGDELQEE